MNDCEIKRVVDETVPIAVHSTLTTLGFDVSNPIETQKDIISLRELRVEKDDDETQKDKFFIRELRNNWSTFKKRVIQVGAGAIALAVFTSFATSFL